MGKKIEYRVTQIMPADGWAVGLALSDDARAFLAEGEEVQIETVRREEIHPLVAWAVVDCGGEVIVDGLIAPDDVVQPVREVLGGAEWWAGARFIPPSGPAEDQTAI